MITHIVLLQLKPGITEDEIETMRDHVQSLQNAIPGLLETLTRANLSMNHQGYTYGFIMRFRNAEYLTAYASHPAHQRVSQELQALCQSIIDFDFE